MSDRKKHTGPEDIEAREEILIEAADSDLYRRNAFRVVELSVDADPRDISRQGSKLKMIETIGGSRRINGVLPLDPLPEIDDIREALQRLQDPVRRLVDEFFWFWPDKIGRGKADEALAALSRDDFKAAAAAWVKYEKVPGSDIAAKHNFAVFAHTQALDMEFKTLCKTLPKKQENLREGYWKVAYSRWKILLDHNPFWDRLNERIRELDDPRLTPGTARGIRNTLPLSILLINAKLALQAAEKNNTPEAKRHLDIMKAWERQKKDSLSPIMAEALKMAVKPIYERIKMLAGNAVAEADENYSRAKKIALYFLQQAKELLKILDIMLPPGHPTWAASRHQAAVAALRCQINYGYQTNDWKGCLELIDNFYPITISGSSSNPLSRE
jgi:hypothetical protein